MTENPAPSSEIAADSAFIELTIEMANLGRIAGREDEEAKRAVDTILKEAAALKRSFEA